MNNKSVYAGMEVAHLTKVLGSFRISTALFSLEIEFDVCYTLLSLRQLPPSTDRVEARGQPSLIETMTRTSKMTCAATVKSDVESQYFLTKHHQ